MTPLASSSLVEGWSQYHCFAGFSSTFRSLPLRGFCWEPKRLWTMKRLPNFWKSHVIICFANFGSEQLNDKRLPRQIAKVLPHILTHSTNSGYTPVYRWKASQEWTRFMTRDVQFVVGSKASCFTPRRATRCLYHERWILKTQFILICSAREWWTMNRFQDNPKE